MNYIYKKKKDYLYHHGIQGQKWGVRKYQNPDGSLTAAGADRYGIEEPGKIIKNEIKGMNKRQLKKSYESYKQKTLDEMNKDAVISDNEHAKVIKELAKKYNIKSYNPYELDYDVVEKKFSKSDIKKYDYAVAKWDDDWKQTKAKYERTIDYINKSYGDKTVKELTKQKANGKAVAATILGFGGAAALIVGLSSIKRR